MRTITGNITLLTDQHYANKSIDFVLCDKYGKALNAFDLGGQIATKKTITTDEDGNFSVELYETEEADISMFYKMQFKEHEDIEDIKLFIQKGEESADFLKFLFPVPDLSMFYEEKNGVIYFKKDVVILIDNFLIGNYQFVSNLEKKLIEEFIKYADDKNENKVAQALDELLGKIVEILSPEYQAVTTATYDDKKKVTDLLQAIGNLESMNSSTLENLNQTQQLVQNAIDEAMEKALIFG